MTATAADSGTFSLGGDLTVNRLGFGAMRITGDGVWGEPPDRELAKRVVREAHELDCTLFDTADSYGPDVSEELIAEAFDGRYPDDLVIATKAGLTRPGPGTWVPDCRPEHLREAVEGSLRKLRVDRIDVLQLHTVDPKVPYAESVGALAELRDEGKIGHVGVSNVSVAQLDEARGIVDVVSVQNRYNLTDRASEDVLDRCAELGIGFIPWFPLAAGDLARPGGPVAEAAERHDASPGQVALAWLLARSEVMLPIPGTGSPAHLEENVAAAELRLEPDELERIAAAAG